ncbi:peroxisome assembly factor [Achlya hypogyna]|uniref:Peroxisomal ATPase PEX6 n=1 Tax=Achlya hypogyna TaxID=1202772 RepID=A0A1V9ZF61_ACHHY|nr:peroxisome assembly factor [Achlya hypogyna]
MAALWCSSFTKLEAPRRALRLQLVALDALSDMSPPRAEASAVLFVSPCTLRRLGLIADALVIVSVPGTSGAHIARACYLRHVPADSVGLSPLLAYNIGLRSSSALGVVEVRPVQPHDLGAPASRSLKASDLPPPATRVEIAPLLLPSVTVTLPPQELLLRALREYFAVPRLLQQGDVFGVPVCDVLQSHRDGAPATVAIPVGAFHDDPSATAAITLPAPLEIPLDIAFFVVQALEASVAAVAHTVARDVTTLVQTAPRTLRLPEEGAMRRYLARPITPANPLPATAAALADLLHPTELPIPMSVLLSGPAGVGKKTMLYEAAATLGLYVLEVCFTDLTSTSELQMLENLRAVTAKAQALAPCVLFLNRFFALEQDDEESALRLGATLAECLGRMDLHGVPLVATVEDASELPPLVRQGFLYELSVEAPTEADRLAMLQRFTASTVLDTDVDLAVIAHRTAGRTMGELRALVADASCLRLADLPELAMVDDGALVNSLTTAAIRMCDLEQALKAQETKSSLGLGNASIPNVKWEDVGGLDHVKDEILDMVQLPLKHPELFASGVRQRSGILLYGPPGTGKTLLAKAIATECNMNFISVKGPELLNMYIGESEKNVRHVFQMVARNARPCILFFDELDSLAPMRGRGSDSGGVMDRVVSQLLTEIDSNLHQVFVVGATNRPDLIESALLRPGRFDRLLYLGICSDKAAQLKVVQALTRKFHLAPDVNLHTILSTCPLHFTGADFYALCSIALANAIKDRVLEIDSVLHATNAEDFYSERPMTPAMVLDKMTPEELQVQVAAVHFERALAAVVPSVSASELAHYEKLRKQFSSLDAKS